MTCSNLQLQIAASIRAARLRAKLSQRQLAHKIQRPRTYVSKLENAHMVPTLRSLLHLSQGIGIPAWKIVQHIAVHLDEQDKLPELPSRFETLPLAMVDPGMTFRQVLGAIIASARVSAGMSQGQMQVRTGLGRSYQSHLENGHHSAPNIETLFLYGEALHMPAWHILHTAQKVYALTTRSAKRPESRIAA